MKTTKKLQKVWIYKNGRKYQNGKETMPDFPLPYNHDSELFFVRSMVGVT
jgi:hypothetical protein